MPGNTAAPVARLAHRPFPVPRLIAPIPTFRRVRRRAFAFRRCALAGQQGEANGLLHCDQREDRVRSSTFRQPRFAPARPLTSRICQRSGWPRYIDLLGSGPTPETAPVAPLPEGRGSMSAKRIRRGT